MDGKHHIKEPGSAITHFIGMLMAIFAAVPLLIKAAQNLYHLACDLCSKPDPVICGEHNLSYLRYLSKGQHDLKKDRSYDDLSTDRRELYSGLPDRPEGKNRHHPSFHRLGDRDRRNPDQGILGILPEVGLFRTLYRYGLDLRPGFHSDPEQYVPGSVRMAARRRDHLHSGRSHLRAEASDLQQQA